MKANKLESLFNDFGIEVYRTKQDGVECAELNTYTTGSVNMIIWLNPFTVESFREWIDSFDINEEIEIHRQSKLYCECFSILNSLEDFTEYIRRMNQICINLEDYQDGRKKYTIKTKFVFEGKFYVKAKSRNQACEFVEKHCGLVMGKDIHSTLSDEVVGWDFDVHPKKIIK
jgi:hypothetical protein